MRALRFHGNRDLRIEKLPDPGVPGPNEVLLAPRFCGICGSDVHEYLDGPELTSAEAHPRTGAALPQILGHEFAGEVLAVGADVDTVTPGDRVAVMPMISCGACYFCRRGENEFCDDLACVGYSAPAGGMSEFALLAADQLVALPDEVSLEQGALLEPAAVALRAVERGGIGPGDSVLVAGAGPIGALVVLAARLAGAAAIFVSEPVAERRRKAAALGVDLAIDPLEVDLAEALRERVEGRGVDVAVECAGNPAALSGCIESTRRGGTVVQLGVNYIPTPLRPSEWTHKGLSICGSWAFRVHGWERIAGLIAAGSLPVERTVTSRVGLEDAADAVAALADPGGSEVKVLVGLG